MPIEMDVLERADYYMTRFCKFDRTLVGHFSLIRDLAATLHKARKDTERLDKCLLVFAGIIKSGGPWTDECQAAVNVARKIASFDGPGAKDAAARASKIQLEQMMW